MGLFTSKIFAGVLAGGFTLAGAGLLFTGTDKLQDASDFVNDAKNRLVQFESNEGALLGKITSVQTDANAKIDSKNVTIADITGKKEALESQVAELNSTIEGLNSQITALQSDLAGEQADHQATQDALDTKTAEYNAKVAELTKAKADIANLNAVIKYAEQKAKEGDVLVKQLEGEITKANAEVDALDVVVNDAETQSADAQPLTQAEIDAVDTSINE